MNKKTLTIDCYYDDYNGESYYLIPSGFRGVVIVVNESPVDCSAWHANKDEAELMFSEAER